MWNERQEEILAWLNGIGVDGSACLNSIVAVLATHMMALEERLAEIESRVTDCELVPEIQMAADEMQDQLRQYEERYGMSSAEFYEAWRNGRSPEIPESVAWAIFYEYSHPRE